MEEAKKRPKVCFVCSSFYPAFVYGGPTFSNYILAKKLSDTGMKVQVVTTNANGTEKLKVDTKKNEQCSNNFHIRYFDETIIGRFSFPLFKGIKKYIKGVELIHLTDMFSTTFLITLFYTRKTNQKIILSTRGILAKWGLQKRSFIKNIWLQLFVKLSVSKINFHATSEKEKTDILRILPTAKVFIVPNGIDIVEEKTIFEAKGQFAEWLQKKGIENEKGIQRICSMGRIHEKKGFDILIKAFAKIQKNFPQTQLLIGGSDDGQLKDLEIIVERLNLKNKVWFLGQLDVENKSILLAGADLFVLPSYDENFGNVYLEALNFGTPVIASKDTPWEAVERHKCGLWISNSVEETAKGLEQLLSEDLSEWSVRAREFAKTFSFENTISEMQKKYLEILRLKT